MADSVDRVFVHALNTVKKIPKTGAARPPAADRMRLYGLYKQAMEGDVDGVMDRPNAYSGLSVDEIRREQDKWDSWNAQRGLGRTEAKRRYIETLIDTMHTYANTQPAAELVSELEFVWNQIKDNSNNNTTSTTNNNNPSPGSSASFRKERETYGGIGVPSPQPDEYYDAFDGRPRKGEAKRERERETDNRRMSMTASDGGPMKMLSPMSEEDEAERENRIRMIEEELAAEVEEEIEEEEEDEEDDEDDDQDDGNQDDRFSQRKAPYDDRGLRRGLARRAGKAPASVSASGRGTGKRLATAPAPPPPPGSNDKDAPPLPSQRWAKMMERAMVKLSAEVAALREQIASSREFRSRQETARRKTGVAAWLGWLGWLAVVVFKHAALDAVLLAAVLVWMRRRKDRRLEDHVRAALVVLREYIRKVLPAR